MDDLKLFMATTLRDLMVDAINEHVPVIIDERVPAIINELVPPMIEASEQRLVSHIVQLTQSVLDAHDEDQSITNDRLRSYNRRITKLEQRVYKT